MTGIRSAQAGHARLALNKVVAFYAQRCSGIRVKIIQSKQVAAALLCLRYEGHLLLESVPQEGDVLLPLLREPNVGGHV